MVAERPVRHLGSEEPVQGATRVDLQDYAFVPANIVVDVGTTVTWTNNDNAGHTVTSNDGSELSSLLFGQTETVSNTFNLPGVSLPLRAAPQHERPSDSPRAWRRLAPHYGWWTGTTPSA